ncbi:PspA/IM30 family protein [Paenibacillus sp. J45TS6]|uniref:PspA/IM30 family protein n=1 Tax=Paenibacillus sp. J45TS6 TaxID=2807196 RepID=UPI001BD0DACF|nr:PspA/IM30 family protein [Paenibacillus sp. J45TS6]
MSILSRFRDIMKANMHDLVTKAEDPEKMMNHYMKQLNIDIGKVKSETASVAAEEKRAKRALDDAKAEVNKLQRYAEKAVESGNEEQALQFLDRKVSEQEKLGELEARYERASSNKKNMKQIQDKLISDLNILEKRRAELNGKIAATAAQQKINAMGSNADVSGSVFDVIEEKVNKAYDEAMAIAELREQPKDDLDDLIAQLERENNKSSDRNAEEELAAIKEKLNNKKS